MDLLQRELQILAGMGRVWSKSVGVEKRQYLQNLEATAFKVTI